jgi:branched-chain amino acid transport system ATP-binding protein
MTILEVEGLTKRFGGLTAVKNVKFEIQEGEIVGLIGPNGAGKTTVFNLISGLLDPDEGRLHLAGRDITGLPPHRKSRLGIGRTFQIVRSFDGMTVLENVMVAILAHDPKHRKPDKAAMDVLKRVGLSVQAQSRPQSITFAQRKRLEVARAFATNPRLILLDEVLAGLNPREVEESLPLIHDIRECGITVFMIEHVMAALMSVSERILVMDEGELIAWGTPDEVTGNPRVIEAYLGDEEEPGA